MDKTPVYKSVIKGYRIDNDPTIYSGVFDLTGKAKITPVYDQVVDTQATAGKMAGQYQTEGENVLKSASAGLKASSSALQNALSPIVSNGAGIEPYLKNATESYGRINQFADEARQSAAAISDQVGKVNANADSIEKLALSLGEYAPILRGMGDTMFGEGSDLIGRGNSYIDQGLSLLSFDRNAGGLAGTYASILAMLDPELRVSQAAGDTMASFRTTRDATQRELSRRGVSSGSGANDEVMRQSANALATALAGIKTRTRQSSVESYLAAMRGAVADATNLGTAGSGIVSQGVSAQAQGANAMQSAAGILVNQGQLQANAANVRAQAGQLLGTQSQALTSAGQITATGGNLALSAANAKANDASTRINAANASLGAAETTFNADSQLATYYAGMFNTLATVAGDMLFG